MWSPEQLKEEYEEHKNGAHDIDIIHSMVEFIGRHKQNPLFPADNQLAGYSYFYRCKRWDKEKGCTIYDKRPIMCKAHPTGGGSTKLPGCTCGVMRRVPPRLRRSWRVPLLLKDGQEVMGLEKTIYVNPDTGEEYTREDILYIGIERPLLLMEMKDVCKSESMEVRDESTLSRNMEETTDDEPRN